MKKIAPLIFAALFAAGCVTPTQTITLHVVESRSALPVQSVAFMAQAPSEGVLIANLFASAANSTAGAKAAQADLKKSAAAVGANVVVIENWNISTYIGTDDDLRIGARAYFVPPKDN